MPNYEYQVGGSLGSDAPSYIVRQADSELYQALVNGDFCYVFNSRQMGKSSLRVRTKDALEAAGFTCVSIDMTSIGSQNITPHQWYKGIAAQMWRGLNLIGKVNFKQWWQDKNDLAPLQCLGLFIEEIILTQVTGEKIFIFIDEIDSVLSLDFKVDDFFALIRQCYNQRSKDSPYNRLGFALFGVTTPSDLIYDRIRTPFNIGRAIELKGFQVHEALSLTKGLEDKFINPQAVLQEIIYWTGGQPFLTQKLCQIAIIECQADRACMMPGEEVNWINQLVHRYIIHDWQAQDEPEHLKTIRDRLIRDEQKAGCLLGKYQQILLQDYLVSDDTPEQIELLLSGLIIKKGANLQIRNPIYREVFNLDWVKQQLDNLRPYAKALNAWQKSLGQDKSRLLRGKALQDAQTWADNHSLNEQDYQFLAASRDLEQQEKQRTLEIEKLKEVQARLVQEKKIARQQRFYLGTLSVALVTTITLGVAAFVQYRQATINEIRALVSSADALFISGRRFDSLLKAIQGMERGRQLRIREPQLKESLESVLRQGVYGAKEYNNLSGHQGTVFAVAISPDGQLIATGGGEDQTVKIWQADGTLLHTLKGHTAKIWDVKFSPDSQMIVSASEDTTVKVWDVRGKLLNTFNSHLDAVLEVAIAPDGRTIASVSRDRTMKLWQPNGRLITTHQAHNTEIAGVAFSFNGQLIATASDDRTVKLWQFKNGQLATIPLATLQGHNNEVMAVAFSPDSKLVATASKDNTVKIWHQDGRLINTLQGHDAPVSDVMFSADGTSLVSVSWDQTIKLWTINGNLLQTITDHSRRIWDLALSPDGQTIATASDRGVKLWKPNSPLLNILRSHSAAVINVAYHPQGKMIASGSDDKKIKLWHQSGRLITTLMGNQEAILSLAYHPNGDNLVSGHSDGTIKLWKITPQNPSKIISFANLAEHTALVWGVAYSPDGQIIASASEDFTIKLWTNSGKLLTTLRGHLDGVRAVAFSPDGKILASASLDGTVKLWNLQGKLLATLRGHNASVVDLEFSPQANSHRSYFLASAGWDNTSKLWKITSDGQTAIANLDQTLVGHSDGVMGVSFSPDGKLIVTGSLDRSLKLWNRHGKLLKTLFGHTEAVWQVEFSPQGKTIISSSEDKTVIIWDLERIYQLDLLAYGCDWIQDYLHTNAEAQLLKQQSKPALCHSYSNSVKN